jgi:E-phenylitaconyl-CoA hydratase
MPTIHVEREGRVVIFTLEGDNDLNLGVVNDEFHRRLLEYRDDDELWCAVVIGAGERAFTAGADMKAMARGGSGRTPWSTRPIDLLNGAEFWKPIIAAINGFALGQGMMLALACDIRIAAETASFGLPEVKYGFPPGSGATQRIPRVIPVGMALEMLMTGDRISAQEAYHWGLVNRVVPPGELRSAAIEIAQRIARNPPLAVRSVKELVMRGREMTLEHGLRLEALLHHVAAETDDATEGTLAFKEKRTPEFKGQ